MNFGFLRFGEYKFDIRDWYENGNVGKGITLTLGELKSLFDLLEKMSTPDESVNELSSDDLDALFNTDSASDSNTEEPTNTTTKESTVLDSDALLEMLTSDVPDYPDDINDKFKELDKLFDGFDVNKKYDTMEFAKESGNRLQYTVTKGSKDFPKYDDVVEKLGLKSFVTGKGNLFIYTL